MCKPVEGVGSIFVSPRLAAKDVRVLVLVSPCRSFCRVTVGAVGAVYPSNSFEYISYVTAAFMSSAEGQVTALGIKLSIMYNDLILEVVKAAGGETGAFPFLEPAAVFMV